MKSLLNFLREPKLKDLDTDDPNTVEIHRQIIRKKNLLWDVYSSFYGEFARVAEQVPPGLLVELGSGGGFIKEHLPSITTSDILHLPEVDTVFSAEAIGFRDSTISAFFLLDVFHHIPDPRKLLNEAQRCLKPGGRLVMIEPANTFWGRLIRKNFHHELHDETAGWGLDGSKPMSSANLALPWIVFVRDREIFQREFPNLSILRYEPHTPLRFLLSGGINYRSLVPKSLIPVVKLLEYALSPFNGFLGMHVTIEIGKLSDNAEGGEGHSDA
jgi:SAM-dependent methyltransferase